MLKKEEINWDLVAKYLAQETNDAENIEIQKLIENNSLDIDEIKKTWSKIETVSEIKSVNTNLAWQKIDSLIDDKSKTNKKRHKNTRFNILKIAAAIIVFIAISTLAYYTMLQFEEQMQIVKNEHVKCKKQILPDGTVVYLNFNATIKYHEKFADNKREVFIDGEAFFDVKRDENKPFIIESGDAFVKVLGTSFNVNTNQTDKNIVVTVESGIVELIAKNDEKPDETNKIVLKAGAEGILTKANNLIKAKSLDENYLAWKTGKLVFRELNIVDVAKILEEVYDVKIVFDNDEIKKYKFSAKFDNQPIDTITKVLSIAFNLKIKKDGKTIIISK